MEGTCSNCYRNGHGCDDPIRLDGEAWCPEYTPDVNEDAMKDARYDIAHNDLVETGIVQTD